MDDKKIRIRKEPSSEWLIENIAEASKNARKLYLLYIGFMAYSALTVVSTSDRQIILNETARLPIVNLDVPLNGFFILAPIIAIFVYIYFQLYLRLNQNLITRLRDLQPSIQKDRIYPWIVNTIEFPNSGSLEKLRLLIIKISLWWLLPLVLMLFPLWFIKKHDPVLSYVVGINPIIGTIVVIWFWYQHESSSLKGVIWRRPGKILMASMVLMFEIFFHFFLIPWAFDGGWSGILKSQIYVDLSYQKLVSEPNTEYKTLYWLNLKGAHLEGANLIGSILKRADLQGAHLQNASMEDANLEGTRLLDAHLQGAQLKQAHLRGAHLTGAELDSANLERAQLQRAVLAYAHLRGAHLEQARLDTAHLLGAKLDGANLKEATLYRAILTEAHLQGAILQGTQFDSAYLEKAQLQGADFRSAWLPGARLNDAQLQSADLRLTNLQGTILAYAHLQGAQLGGANLQDAYIGGADLNIEQLCKAKTLFRVQGLDSMLMEQVKKKCPELLEEPQSK